MVAPPHFYSLFTRRPLSGKRDPLALQMSGVEHLPVAGSHFFVATLVKVHLHGIAAA